MTTDLVKLDGLWRTIADEQWILARNTLKGAWEQGGRLIEAQEATPPGQWGKRLKDVGLVDRTARKWMAIRERWPECAPDPEEIGGDTIRKALGYISDESPRKTSRAAPGPNDTQSTRYPAQPTDPPPTQSDPPPPDSDPPAEPDPPAARTEDEVAKWRASLMERARKVGERKAARVTASHADSIRARELAEHVDLLAGELEEARGLILEFREQLAAEDDEDLAGEADAHYRDQWETEREAHAKTRAHLDREREARNRLDAEVEGLRAQLSAIEKELK